MKQIFLLITLLLSLQFVQAQPGTLDSSFGENGKVYYNGQNLSAQTVAIQKNGKIIEAGAGNDSINFGLYLVRFNPNGSVDKSFGKNGRVITSFPFPMAIAFQSNGKIVVAAVTDAEQGSDIFLTRFFPDGSFDTSFGDSGTVITNISQYDDLNAMAIQDDDKIVVTGMTRNAYYGGVRSFVFRYTKNGKPDKDFGIKGKVITVFDEVSEITGITVQPDGKILTCGVLNIYVNETVLAIRYMPDGQLDAGFGNNGLATLSFGVAHSLSMNSIVVQEDGKIVAGGIDERAGEPDHFGLVRFTSSGHPDPSFGINGTVTTTFGLYDSEIKSVLIQPDGKIVGAGNYWGYTDFSDDSRFDYFALARYNSNGNLDSSFGTNGLQTTDVGPQGYCVGGVLSNDGHIIAAGEINKFKRNNQSHSAKFVLAGYKGGNTNSIVKNQSNRKIDITHLALKLYPNPASNILHIEGLPANTKTKLTITDLNGNVRITTTANTANFSWNISRLQKGSYTLRLEANNRGTSATFIKE